MQKISQGNEVLFPVPVQVFSCKFTGTGTPLENTFLSIKNFKQKPYFNFQEIPFSIQWNIKFSITLKDV